MQEVATIERKIPEVQALENAGPPIIKEHGLLWLRPGLLAERRFSLDQPFAMFSFGGVVFEIQGRRHSDGWCWIERVDEELGEVIPDAA